MTSNLLIVHEYLVGLNLLLDAREALYFNRKQGATGVIDEFVGLLHSYTYAPMLSLVLKLLETNCPQRMIVITER